MTTDLAANATNLGVTKLIRFPDERANKIGVDLSLLVPRADLKSRQLGEEVFYNVDVIGEVAKDDRLIDNFKYRFDIPTEEVGGEKIPLTVRRYLYPGQYRLILKVSDGNQNAEGRITENLTVPDHPDAPPPIETATEAALRDQIVFGSTDEVAEQIRAFADATRGDLHFIARLYWPGMHPDRQREVLRRFAHDVIPRLR